jgi:hypothetical protein
MTRSASDRLITGLNSDLLSAIVAMVFETVIGNRVLDSEVLREQSSMDQGINFYIELFRSVGKIRKPISALSDLDYGRET